MDSQLNKRLVCLLLALVVFILPHFYVDDSGSVTTNFLLFPEFIVFSALSALVVLLDVIKAWKRNRRFIKFLFIDVFSSWLFYHGLFSLCFFSLSGLGMVQWLFTAIYIVLVLFSGMGIINAQASFVDASVRRLYEDDSDVFIVTTSLIIFVAKVVIELFLPTNIYTETLRYNKDAQNLISIIIIIFFSIALFSRMLSAINKLKKNNDNADNSTPKQKTKITFPISKIIKKFGFAYFLIFVVVSLLLFVVLPLSIFVIELSQFLTSIMEAVWSICEIIASNLTVRRYTIPMDKLSAFTSGICFVFVVLYVVFSRYKDRD